jgi:hypothetical protein
MAFGRADQRGREVVVPLGVPAEKQCQLLVDAVSDGWSCGAFHLIHQAGNVAALGIEHRCVSKLQQDEPTPYRLVFISGSRLQVNSPRSMKRIGQGLESFSLAAALRGLQDAFCGDRVISLPPGADVLSGLLAAFLDGHYWVLAQGDPAALRHPAPSYSKLYNESRFATAAAMGSEPAQSAAPEPFVVASGFEPRVQCAAC